MHPGNSSAFSGVPKRHRTDRPIIAFVTGIAFWACVAITCINLWRA